MAPTRDLNRLTLIGLIVLGLVAAGLSLAALLQHRTPRTAVVGTASTPTGQAASRAPASPRNPLETSPEPSPTPSPTPTPEPPSPTAPVVTVVIVGDSHSVGDPATTWVGQASGALGWTKVVNLSAPGRGFLAAPRSCDGSPCTPFGGTVAATAAEHPDVVVTFGGVADGDLSITQPAADYFQALRAALPQAKLVAISPVTTDATAPYWLTMHTDSVRTGVEAVGGIFVDVGQPGLGNGNQLSVDAQAAIARAVVDALD